jgi:hypothetical protein
MKPKITMLFSVALLTAPAQSFAADFPKSGQAEYDTYYVFENQMTIDADLLREASTISPASLATSKVKGRFTTCPCAA